MKPQTALAWIVVAALTAWYANNQVVTFLADPGRLHANDFKHLYLGALFLRSGQNPYDAREFREAAHSLSLTEDRRFGTILPYVYLPFTGIALIPLTWFRFDEAVWIWFWINQVLFLAGGWLAARAVGLPQRAGVFAFVMFLLAFNTPLSRTLTAGQLNGVLLFCFALVLWMDRRAPPWATGAVAAFAALFKLTPGILLFWFLAERKTRQAGWMAAFAVLLWVATLPIAGIGTNLAFLPVLRDMGYGRSTWAQLGQHFYRDAYNQSLNSFYHHAVAADPAGEVRPWLTLGPTMANVCTVADTLALVAATAWLVLLGFRSRPLQPAPSGPAPIEPCLRYSLLLVLSLLIPSICWDHYLVALVLPVLVLARFGVEWGVGRVSLMVFGVIVVGTGASIPFDASPFRQGLGIVVMSAKLWTTVALWGLLAWALVRAESARASDVSPNSG